MNEAIDLDSVQSSAQMAVNVPGETQVRRRTLVLGATCATLLAPFAAVRNAFSAQP